jgi:hypothetical protein
MSTPADKLRTAGRFRWLDQVGADPELTPLCFRLAYAISTFINRTTGDAWPGQARLAADCHATDRSIRDALTMLRERSHLRMTGRGGRGKTSRYRPIMIDAETRNCASTFTDENPEDGFHVTEPKPGNFRPKTRKKTTLNPEENDTKRGSQLPTIPLREPIEEPFEDIESQKFAAWYSIFPKKVARKKALKVYRRIIKNGEATHDELLDGAERYAAEVVGREARFIKQPDGWLSDGRWADEAAPAFNRKPETLSRGDSAIEGMRSYLNEDSTYGQ